MTNNTSTNLATILLVEDEPAVRQLFAQALSRAGYAVYEARNGQEAMRRSWTVTVDARSIR